MSTSATILIIAHRHQKPIYLSDYAVKDTQILPSDVHWSFVSIYRKERTL